MTDVTCRLTAKNRDQLWNATLGNQYGLPLPFLHDFTLIQCCGRESSEPLLVVVVL